MARCRDRRSYNTTVARQQASNRRLPTRTLGRSALVALALVAALVGGCGDDDAATPTGAPTSHAAGGIALAQVVGGLDSPTQTIPLTETGDRLWIVERAGRVRLVKEGALQPDPVLDIADRVKSGGEQGLLSLALHPRFAENDLVYIHLSDPDGDTRVEEHRVTSGRIAPEPERVLLEVDQPYSNHNGGSVAFGPDGRLYLGLGDGGSGNDPEERAQDLDSRLGKLLRLDVDAPAADWEIAAYGLRNPWRFAFDPQTGDAWMVTSVKTPGRRSMSSRPARGFSTSGGTSMKAATRRPPTTGRS